MDSTNNSNDMNGSAVQSDSRRSSPSTRRSKVIVFAVLALIIGVVALVFRDELTLRSLASWEAQLREFQEQHPIAVYAIAFAVYVSVTGLSLPGAAALTLLYGWYFGFTRGLVLVSFASTAGATIAFLSSRFFLREAVQARYGESLASIQKRLADEGAFYLFTLRLIPAVPFFVINLAMGLTPIKTRTFWWVSQLGMLPGTAVYVYAGRSVPDLKVLAEDGAGAVFEPRQLFQLAIAFALLGIFPLAVRRIVAAFTTRSRAVQ